MSAWRRVAGRPGDPKTAVLVDGPGWDFNALISIEDGQVLIRGKDAPDSPLVLPLADFKWLIGEYEAEEQ